MIKVNKPNNLNARKLLAELIEAGITTLKPSKVIKGIDYEVPFIDGNGDFWLLIDESEKTLAEQVCSAHSG